MSCQFGMLNFNKQKCADLGWMPRRCECCMCTVGFQRHLLALCTENLWALFAHSDAKPLVFVLPLGKAGESMCRECVGHIGSAAGEAPVPRLEVPLMGRLVPGIAWHRSVARATGVNYPKSEGKGYEVSCSVRQVEYKEE